MVRLPCRSYGRGCARGLAAVARRSLWPALVLASGLAACSGEQVLGDYPPSTCDLSELPASSGRQRLKVATFWRDAELKALDSLLPHSDPRYRVEMQPGPTRVDVQLHIRDAFESWGLPDIFQVNGGSDVLRWVATRPSEATGVCPLDDVVNRLASRQSYFPSVLAPLSCRDQLFALPVGVHHLNLLFYNHELFAELQQTAQKRGLKLLEPSELGSVYELLDQLERIAELGLSVNGAPVIPLALGTSVEWPLTILAFENVLLSLSRDAYKMLWEGGLAVGSGHSPDELAPILDEMLEVLRAIVAHSELSVPLSWQDALLRVGDGAAVFTVTGDWGWAQLSDAQRKRVTTISYPGTADSFVYTPDSFAVPRELGGNGFSARSFLQEVVSRKNHLIDFAKLKHAIPPHKDLDEDEIAELGTESLQDTYRQFQDCERGGCELLLAVSGLAPPPGIAPCFDDMDALLRLAVTELPPSEDRRIRCPGAFPQTSDDAAKRLVELLLEVAKQRFASECR